MLTVRYGPFAALEDAFLKELDGLKQDDPFAHVAIVAPSRRMAERLARLSAGDRPRLAVHFHTFFSLASEIVREAGGAEPSLITDPMFFDRLVDSLLGSDPRPRGLASSYRSTLKDLIDAGVEPRAAELVQEGLLKDKEEAEHLSGLLGLLARCEARLKALGVMSSAGLTRRAAELASSSLELSRYKALLYYGFYDLTGLQADFFEAVAREFPVTVFFPYEKGHPAFAFADRFFETRLHQGGAAPRSVEPEGGGPRHPRAALRIFNASGESDEAWRAAKEILRLVEEEGFAYSDIGVVARTLEPYRSALVEAFRSSAVPFHTSAAEPLLRRPAARAAQTLLTLGRRDFPALAVEDLLSSPFFRRGPSSSFPHARALIRRLRIHRGWLRWEGRLAPLARRDFELKPELRAEGRPGSLVPKEESAALWDLLKRWKRDLEPGGRRTWSKWVEHALGFIERYLDGGGDVSNFPNDVGSIRPNLRTKHRKYVGLVRPEPTSSGCSGRRSEDLDEAFAALRGEIEALRRFDLFGEEVAFGDFLDAAQERLSRASVPVCQGPNLGVRVLDAMEARGESFKALFLIGLKQGLFPRIVREDPLLRDVSRKALRDNGGYWIAAKQEGYDEERLLFRLLVSSARERLYLSYPRSDEEGRAQVPSIYLFDLCREAGLELSGGTGSEHVPRQPLQRLASEGLSRYLSPREASIAAALSGGDPSGLHEALGWDAGRLKSLRGRAEELNRFGEPGPMDGMIGKPSEFLARLRKSGVSPTALQTLASCPFQFFAAYVLGLDEPLEPSEAGEIDARLKGSLYHAALAAFYRRLLLSGAWPKGAELPEKAFQEALEEAFQGLTWRELGLYPLIWDVARERMIEALRAFLRFDLAELMQSGFRPALLETEMKAALPIRLPEPLSGLRFRGKPDRVDVSNLPNGVGSIRPNLRTKHRKYVGLVRPGPTSSGCSGRRLEDLDAKEGAFRVIDYKTSAQRESLAKLVASGRTFQPPVYLELAGQRKELSKLRSAGARFYAVESFLLDEERGQCSEYPADEHESVRESVFARLSQMLEALARGEFPIRPDEGAFGRCGFCPFQAMCRKNHPMTLVRAKHRKGVGLVRPEPKPSGSSGRARSVK
ncbi:MAG: PD-(D/E)XK nuclease family protein [Elusimicrobia bacterium]|nr:PD-(D/E)XK nuclease family protein [Elusimicrobiota bacterium]